MRPPQPLIMAKSTKSKVEVESVVVPVVHETAQVSTRTVDRGGVRVSKVVHEIEETIPTPAIHEEIEIERVARDVWLDKPAETRQEGDTTIIPVMEEVIVAEKRLRLTEEIHIRRRKVNVPGEEKVKLRREEIRIDDERDRTRR